MQVKLGTRESSADRTHDARFYTDPKLLVLQSRLFSPSYAGPGRWIIFQPETRRAFLAVGGPRAEPRTGWETYRGMPHQDEIPNIIRILQAATNGAEVSELLKSVPEKRSASQLERLIKAGILVEQRAIEKNDTFIYRFHLSNFDFPFLDYFDPDWLAKDAAMMRNYARTWPMPPLLTERSGVARNFPDSRWTDLVGNAKRLDAHWLAAILRFTFGPIGEIEFSTGRFLRKTSPSGGARHPTETIILIPPGIESLPEGAYYYDVGRHALVEVAQKYRHSLPRIEFPGIGFLITSRVERPMWRYRETRSFRPVLLDAGHVVETLALLLGAGGYQSQLMVPAFVASNRCEPIIEPELALLVTWPSDVGTMPRLFPGKSLIQAADGREDLWTNPTAYLDFTPEGLRVRTVWPSPTAYTIGLEEFAILNYCIPSTRGDRVTTLIALAATFPKVDSGRLRALCESKALLPRRIVQEIYPSFIRWAQHGWYLSLLAHLEARASAGDRSLRDERNRERESDSQPFLTEQLVEALKRRRTTRAFIQEPITRSQLESLLEAIPATPTIRVFVAAIQVAKLTPGLYEWIPKTRQIHSRINDVVGNDVASLRDQIRRLTIGQHPASAGAVAIWLVRYLTLDQPDLYERQIIEIGRIGQRICLAASAQDLGVFLTPALCDKETFNWLGIREEVENVAYVFSIGQRKGPVR